MGLALTAVVVRAVFIWIGRPEFLGWFNHSYCYYVETRGLLTTGSLPYPDMPLLFWLYAASARLVHATGMALDAAIVHGSRFWMCVIPGLLVPTCYRLLRDLNAPEPLGGRQWVLVAGAGFLPLTLVHMPEMLQKNMLGLLLFALGLGLTLDLQQQPSAGRWARLAALTVVIALTHFGTAIVFGLWIVAAVTARLVQKGRAGQTVRLLGIGAAAIGLVSAIVWIMDPARGLRIWHYAQTTLGQSWAAVLLVPGERWAAAVVVGGYLLLMAWLLRSWRRRPGTVSAAKSEFWLSSVLFVGPLALGLILLLDRHTFRSRWVVRLWPVGVAAGVGVLTLGEGFSAMVRGRAASAAHADLISLKQSQGLGPEDLVVAPTGAEHAANWFLGTKAGVVTTLTQHDFSNYRRVYVLNPIQGELNFRELAGMVPDTPEKAYLIMRRNIPAPANAKNILRSEELEFWLLPESPKECRFDAAGRWDGYGDAAF